jgi:hypothetical protein
MFRNLGISLLLLSLLAAGIDGFRVRERVNPVGNAGTAATTEEADVHSAENGGGNWPR